MKMFSEQEIMLASRIGRMEMSIRFRPAPMTEKEVAEFESDKAELGSLREEYRLSMPRAEWRALIKANGNNAGHYER